MGVEWGGRREGRGKSNRRVTASEWKANAPPPPGLAMPLI